MQTIDDMINSFKNIFVIKDETGATANEYFTVIKANAKTHGYSVVNIANPFLPNILLDGINSRLYQ